MLTGSRDAAAAPAAAVTATGLHLRLDGFEGPLDLLLDLARRDRIDLRRISVLALAEQFGAVIEAARAIRIELAADWLVMAAWLAWLKSRLLLPRDPAEAAEADDDAERLARRLADLARVRALARWLDHRPVLGRDVHRRGAPENTVVTDRSALRVDLASLVGALASGARRRGRTRGFAPVRHRFWTVADALARLERMLGAPAAAGAAWWPLDRFVPDDAERGAHGPEPDGPSPLARPAAIASTLLAGLELARNGTCELRQAGAFGPVLLRRRAP